MSLSRRRLLAFLFYGTASAALAKAPEVSQRPLLKPEGGAKRLAKPAADTISKAALGGTVSFAVADARTGEMLETYRPLVSHPPASVVKSLTTLFALETLGPGHRFRTCFLGTTPIVNGVLNGDLVLTGTGDPTLDTDHLFEMIKALKEVGLREVRGRFQYFDAALPPIDRIDASQPDHLGYNPALSGLNLNFNRIYLEWVRQGDSYQIAMEARALSVRPGVTVASTRVADRKSPIFDYRQENGRDRWSVAKSALGKKGGRWLPSRNPGAYIADVARTLARSNGLVLKAPEAVSTKPKGVLLAEHRSDPLAEISRGMLKFSTNLTAEVLGVSASIKHGDAPEDLPASGAAMSDWLKDRFRLNKVDLVDHSGLGDASNLSAQEMVKCLVGAGPEGTLRSLLKPFALPDEDNKATINGPVQVVAKTGTLNFVSGLAGYISTPSGRDLAFAIFASDLPRRATLTIAQRERPRGGRAWAGRSRTMQRSLIERWALLYDQTEES